jgi:hypothetical protein
MKDRFIEWARHPANVLNTLSVLSLVGTILVLLYKAK